MERFKNLIKEIFIAFNHNIATSGIAAEFSEI